MASVSRASGGTAPLPCRSAAALPTGSADRGCDARYRSPSNPATLLEANPSSCSESHEIRAPDSDRPPASQEPAQICGGGFDPLRLLGEQPDCRVAFPAQDAAHPPARMAMINVRPLAAGLQRLSANGAPAALGGQQSLKGFKGKAIAPQQILAPFVGVCLSPGFGSGDINAWIVSPLSRYGEAINTVARGNVTSALMTAPTWPSRMILRATLCLCLLSISHSIKTHATSESAPADTARPSG